MRRTNKKGDVFFIQEIVVWIVLVLVAVLLFGLFWINAVRFHEKVSSHSNIDESIGAVEGGIILRVYLQTPLDEPPEKYGETSMQSHMTAVPGTFEDAWRAAFEDEACRDWLTAHGNDYFDKEKGYNDDPALWSPPTTQCGELLYRTASFFNVLCSQDYLLEAGNLVIGPGFEEYLNKDEVVDPTMRYGALLTVGDHWRAFSWQQRVEYPWQPEHFALDGLTHLYGEQSLPEPPVTFRLHCIGGGVVR